MSTHCKQWAFEWSSYLSKRVPYNAGIRPKVLLPYSLNCQHLNFRLFYYGRMGSISSSWRTQARLTRDTEKLNLNLVFILKHFEVGWLYTSNYHLIFFNWPTTISVPKRKPPISQSQPFLSTRFREASPYQNVWIFGKVPKGGGGHFQSKNFCCKFWTFEQGFFGIKMIQRGIFRVCFSIIWREILKKKFSWDTLVSSNNQPGPFVKIWQF